MQAWPNILLARRRSIRFLAPRLGEAGRRYFRSNAKVRRQSASRLEVLLERDHRLSSNTRCIYRIVYLGFSPVTTVRPMFANAPVCGDLSINAKPPNACFVQRLP